MRRNYSGRSDALVNSSQGEQGFWPSYADMMSAVALILFFLMLLSYIQNLITGNDLQNTQELLDDTQAKLELTIGKVKDAEEELKNITLDLNTAKQTLSDQKDEIAKQQSIISEQKNYMSAADEELVAMRSQMQTIAVLRLSILEQIRDSIVEVMGDASKVNIGENGNIILNEGVLFDLGSSEIKPESRAVLDKLIQVFGTFLYDSENAKYVDSIVISGHTDITGTDEENRRLSTDRANSVLSYLLTQNGGGLGPYAKYFCAAGYGSTRPVADNGTEEGRATNRRIEISMILKDETVLDIVDDYLKIELPEPDKVPIPPVSGPVPKN
ncbi:MAG: OmpA family protein [Candidatus Limivicinus sp.]|jgi:chemotaxis protein MotB